MRDAFSYQIIVPFGGPAGTKIITQFNWTGICIAFPRTDWDKMKTRPEFSSSGVYVLLGPEENSENDLPAVYVGEGEKIGKRIQKHYKTKEFWDWCYAFVATENALNKAHIKWLEYSLLKRSKEADRSIRDNTQTPRKPSSSESMLTETQGFLDEMLQILPLLGVDVFNRPVPVSVHESSDSSQIEHGAERDTVVVPANEEGFNRVFLGQDCWWAIDAKCNLSSISGAYRR